MSISARDVARIADRSGLVLSQPEIEDIVAIIRASGSIKPTTEVVNNFKDGLLTPQVLTFFLPRMWRDRIDDSPVPTELWRHMFERAEFTVDIVVRVRPRRAVRAYRGATEATREGLSWSLDPNQAEYFARSRQAPGILDAKVWVTNIPADSMFAHYTDGWEQEITADARGLDIRTSRKNTSCPSRTGGGSGGSDGLDMWSLGTRARN